MRIGAHLTAADDIGDFARGAADAAARGLHGAWTNQQPGGWDPLTVLSALPDGPAELGTAVVPTYPRHPVALATEALTVQALTGGRLTLGIGPGHAVHVTGALGLPYTSPARHTREYLEVLRPLLRGETVAFRGEHFTVDTGPLVRATPPPVLLSALGPRMLAVARDLAEGTIAVWVRPDTVADHLVPSLGDGARVVVTVVVSVTSDPDGLREGVARDFALVGDLPAYRAVLDRGGLAGPADTVVAGDEEHVLAELRRFGDAGATDLVVSAVGTPAERERVLDVAAQLAREAS
ncbi:TIGR03564 family F420-dependent LLM class oxidoreductase [Umezawaea sp.]|uniref:TIGR03564 family F420-dependent LLM class oxidoreductase n=1 Tax=Umezawaea sp. TaxID=1955258 RepID=UPI002ED00AA2